MYMHMFMYMCVYIHIIYSFILPVDSPSGCKIVYEPMGK